MASSNVDLRDASNNNMSVLGSFQASLSTMAGVALKTLTFHVIKGLVFPVVLGNAFLCSGTIGKVTPDGTGTFELDPERKLKYRLHSAAHATLHSLAAPSVPLHSRIETPYKLGPRQTCHIPCTPGRLGLKINSSQLIEASPMISKQHPTLVVRESVATPGHDGSMFVVVSNVGRRAFTIHPGAEVAIATLCDVSAGTRDMINTLSWSPQMLGMMQIDSDDSDNPLGNFRRPDDDKLSPAHAAAVAAVQEEEGNATLCDDRPEDDDDKMSPPSITADEVMISLSKLQRPVCLSDTEWTTYRNEVLLPYVDVMKWGPRDPDQVAKVLTPHRIDLIPGAQPVHSQPYQKAPAARAEEARQVSEMRADGITVESNSPWSSPTVLARKAGGTWRFCVDYRKLNAITVKDVYPLPRVDETLDLLRHARYITTVDLKAGFWQIPMDKSSRERTAFVFSGGLHEYVFMPFGLCNAPATFQRTMDTVLAGMKWQFCFPYLDDIIVYSRTFAEHVKHCKQVFERLRQYGLSISLKKCQFATNEVRFLGHVVKDGTISPNPDKVKAVQAMPYPKDRKSLQAFLGLVNYYRQFIKNFSETAVGLHQLAAQRARGTDAAPPYQWTDVHTAAFDKLRDALCNAPVLQCPDFSRPFIVHTDASDFALGAVLSQEESAADGMGKQVDRPVAYLSRVLNEHERNYDTTQRECLAVVFAIKKWRHYLEGATFRVVTDHIALKWLLGQKQAPNQRLARWILHLQEFDFTIEHRAGAIHQNADALSRCVTAADPAPELMCSMADACDPNHCIAKGNSPMCAAVGQKVSLNVMPWNAARWSTSLLQVEQLKDEPLAAAIKVLIAHGTRSAPTQEEEDALPYHDPIKTGTTAHYGSAAAAASTSPPQRTPASTRLSTDTLELPDVDLTKIGPAITKAAGFVRRHKMVLRGNTLCHVLVDSVTHPSAPFRIPRYVPVMPLALRKTILEEAHDSPAAGHPGITATYQAIRPYCYWPGIADDVKDYVGRCHPCQINRLRPSHHIPLLPLPIAPHPFHTVGMDFMKLPKSSNGNQYLLVFTDYLTRWVEAVPTVKQDGATVAQALLDHVVARHGLPKVLLSDQGKAFCEGVAAELYKKLDVHKKATTPYHPQCNGLTERFNRTCIEMLSRWHVVKQDTEWDTHLPMLLWAYRCHWHSDFRASPFYMLYGRDCGIPVAATIDHIDPRDKHFLSRFEYVRDLMRTMPEIWKFARECLDDIADRYRAHNLRHQASIEPPYSIGSPVYVRILDSRKISKDRPKWVGPYIVRGVPSAANYELSLPDKPDDTILLWAGHVRLAKDFSVDGQLGSDTAAAPVLPYNPDDLDHDD